MKKPIRKGHAEKIGKPDGLKSRSERAGPIGQV